MIRCLANYRPVNGRRKLMAIRMKIRGFTLVEMLVVIAIIAILAAALFPAIQGAMDQARATAMKTRGRGIWLAITTANMEREPLNLASIWPGAQGADEVKGKGTTDYFNTLLAGSGEDRLASDLSDDMLAAGTYKAAPEGAEVTAGNIAWRLADVSSEIAGAGQAFLISKDLGNSDGIIGTNTPVEFAVSGPFKGRRILWVTVGGGVFDARRRYVKALGALAGNTNEVTLLSD